jgi:hypothetical protein
VLFFAWAMALVQARPKMDATLSVRLPGVWARRAIKWIFALALMGAISSITLNGFPEIGEGNDRAEAYQEGTHITTVFPRFWHQGWIGPLPDDLKKIGKKPAPPKP